MKPLFSNYSIRWDFSTKLCASVPANPELVKAWLDARSPKAIPPAGASIREIQEEVLQTIVAEAEPPRTLLIFQNIDGKLVMRAATVRAHMKECARVISVNHVGRIKGEQAFSTRVINCVYPDPKIYWIPILRFDGMPVISADGRFDKPVRTPYGSALKTFEYIEGARMDFRLQVLGNRVSMADLQTIFDYGGVHGYAGERGDGEGKYICTIKKENENDGNDQEG